MKVLTADQILKCNDLKKQAVAVPEWGKDAGVYIRTLTGTERDKFEEEIVKVKGDKTEINYKNMRAKLVALTACTKSGSLIFNQSHVEALGKKSAAALDRLFSVAQKINGMSAEDVKQLTKN